MSESATTTDTAAPASPAPDYRPAVERVSEALVKQTQLRAADLVELIRDFKKTAEENGRLAKRVVEAEGALLKHHAATDDSVAGLCQVCASPVAIARAARAEKLAARASRRQERSAREIAEAASAAQATPVDPSAG